MTSAGPGRKGQWRGESGQTVTEYLMILGLLTAMIIALTKIIVPGMTYVVVTLAKHVAIFLSSAG